MSERFSIKGKGAELFFGDAAENRVPPPEPDTARQTDSMLVDKTAGRKDSTTERQTARQTDATSGDTWSPEIVGLLRQALLDPHPVHNTFRYSQGALDAVRDIVYELEVKRGIKTSRNDVMRLALSWIINDYRSRGASSLLVVVMKEERWKP